MPRPSWLEEPVRPYRQMKAACLGSVLLPSARRKSRLIGFLLLAFVLVGAAGACSVWKTVPLIPDTGGHPAQMRLKGSLKMTGIVKITLPGDRVLEGKWDEVRAETDLEAVTVSTPGGEVSAADLAGDEGPSLIVNLWGDGLRMICVCTGDDQSGYTGTCIDSDGTRWASSHRF